MAKYDARYSRFKPVEEDAEIVAVSGEWMGRLDVAQSGQVVAE